MEERRPAEARSSATPIHRVLVVDHHPVTRAGIARLVDSQADFEVCAEAGDLATAFAHVDRSRPDIVTLDLTFGKESSLSRFDRLREHHPGLPILVISMHDEMTHGYRAVSEGANGYVQKDAEPEVIIRALRTVLEGGTAISPGLAALFVGASLGKNPSGKVMSLSKREFEAYQLIGIGLATREIAAKLGISPRTVESHKENMKKKLGVGSSAALARHAVQFIQGNPPLGG